MTRRPTQRSALSRRELLFRTANGFGGLALASLLASCSHQSAPPATASRGAGKRARSVIFLFMSGGPSHIDTFDPKPRLRQEHGQPIKVATPPVQFNGCNIVMQSPFRFKKHGQCGADVSEIFPHVAECVDDIAFIRSMTTEHGEHGTGNVFMNTGSPFPGRPSMGSWVSYGLGRERDELPAYVVLESGRIPVGGMGCFSNAFLPASHRGTIFSRGSILLPDLQPREPNTALQKAKLDLVEQLNRESAGVLGVEQQALDEVIKKYETAFTMQTAVPDVVDFSQESAATISLYGIDKAETEVFGARCLMARRLVERGVSFVQLLPPRLDEYDQWDQHEKLREGHRDNALATDKPIAGLLKDLKARGLLDETLVLWGGEFGRTPMQQDMPASLRSRDGRGHNPYGFTTWMAGGGVRGGITFGATDDYGIHAIENPVNVHDLHATVLHLLGVDHTKLTYRYGGRDFRLTDVYGEVIRGILA